MAVTTASAPKRAIRTRPRLSAATRFAVGAIWVVAVFSILGNVITMINLTTGRTLFALGGADGRLPLSTLPQLLQAELGEGAHGTLADAALSLRVISALPSLLNAVTIAVAAILLVGILRKISFGQPFSVWVLKRWRSLTVVLLAGGVLQGLADTAAVVYLSTNIGLLFGAGNPSIMEARDGFLGGYYSGIGVDLPHWPIPLLLGGIIALALSIAFRAGARLEEEADGVV